MGRSEVVEEASKKSFTCTITFLFLNLFATLAHANRQVFVPGDILLGGLFPIHAAGRNATQTCGRIKADQGVQRMVAMLYALEAINKDSTLLPGIRLGAQILDTCSVETHALEQSLEFIKTATERLGGCSDGSPRVYSSHLKPRQPVAAVVGAASSQVSVMVASMLQLFKIPMLSYSSTGVELSEKPRFAYFSRVVPPDNLQAKAMAHLIWKLEWNYVIAIADSGSYGERGMDSFRAAATERNICIDGDIHKINRRWTDDQFKDLLLRMRHSSKARGVVMFVDEDNLLRFLTILKRLIQSREHPELRNHFWFVASDSWGMKGSVVKGFEQIVTGAITIAPKVRFLKGFNEYFAELTPSNTFLSEYWQSMSCSDRINGNFGRCFSSMNYQFKQEAYVPFVYDAVQLLAGAIHTYVKEDCGWVADWSECPLSTKGFEGQRLQSLYRNASLLSGYPPLIDDDGDGIGQYNIFQLDNRGIYQKVGGWMAGSQLDLDVHTIRRGLQRLDLTLVHPVSVCSVSCGRGQYRAYQDQCCWTCIPCDISTSIIPNDTSCIECPLGMVPDFSLIKCVPIRPVYLEWTSGWALIPAVFSASGLIATGFVTFVFIRFNYTPVVMASGRELCYCMLFGISLCYLITFVLVSRPAPFVCALARVLLGSCLAIVYASILVKTNRLDRVFKPSSALRPRFISPIAQVGLCGAIVLVQVGGTLIWLWVSPSDTTIQYPSRTEAVLSCKFFASHLLISLVYNMFLVLACTIYAFKTRKIPENFNETRLIGFTMYSTCILWLSFGPIYFATQHNFRIQLTSLCMAISMSGTVALACFFGPKVYICLFQPYKNVRTRSSAVGKLVNQQMRFISQLTTNGNDESPQTKYRLPLVVPVTNKTSTSLLNDYSTATTTNTSTIYDGGFSSPNMHHRIPGQAYAGATQLSPKRLCAASRPTTTPTSATTLITVTGVQQQVSMPNTRGTPTAAEQCHFVSSARERRYSRQQGDERKVEAKTGNVREAGEGKLMNLNPNSTLASTGCRRRLSKVIGGTESMATAAKKRANSFAGYLFDSAIYRCEYEDRGNADEYHIERKKSDNNCSYYNGNASYGTQEIPKFNQLEKTFKTARPIDLIIRDYDDDSYSTFL